MATRKTVNGYQVPSALKERKYLSWFKPKSWLLRDSDLGPGSYNDLLVMIEALADQQQLDADFAVTVSAFGQSLKLYYRQPADDELVAAYQQRKCAESACSVGRPKWHYDYNAQKALKAIIKETYIGEKPCDFMGRRDVYSDVENTMRFRGAKKYINRALLPPLWDEIEAAADKAFTAKFNVPVVEHYREIKGFNKKPHDWPESDIVTIMIDGEPLRMGYAGPESSNEGAWNIVGNSRLQLADIYTARSKKAVSASYSLTDTARELGIHKTQRNREANSTRPHLYRDLESLYAQLGKLADALTENEQTASIEVKHLNWDFRMVKPEGSSKWRLDEASLPSVRAALGLSPEVAAGAPKSAQALMAGWGVAPAASHVDAVADSKSKGWSRD